MKYFTVIKILNRENNIGRAEKGCGNMRRQCAWCLYLINQNGERITSQPLPNKLYEASHGICGVCGQLWMEQAAAHPTPVPVLSEVKPKSHTVCKIR